MSFEHSWQPSNMLTLLKVMKELLKDQTDGVSACEMKTN